MPWNNSKKKPKPAKSVSALSKKKTVTKDAKDPKEYVKTLKITRGNFPDVLKWKEGLCQTLQAEYGEVAKRLSVKPSTESAFIDELTEDDVELSQRDYDWTVPADVAKYNFDKIRKQKNLDLVEKRAAMHARIIEQNVSAEVLKQAQLTNPDAMDSKYTPTSVWIEYILSAIFQGDIAEYQKSVRTRLNEYSQAPDVTDEEYIETGRALVIEATALNVQQTEKDLVITGMKNLCPQWRAVKNEYLLRPTNVETFDAMEKYLLDKKHLKDVVMDPTLFLEQNIVEPSKQAKKGDKKKDKKKPEKGVKPSTGAVVNPTAGSCFLCEGQHKLATCKFLPVCQEVIKSMKERIVDEKQSKMKQIIAAAMATSIGEEKEADFATEISSYFAPVLVASDEDEEEVADDPSESTELVAAATRQEVDILFDTGAAVNLFTTSFGNEVFDGPPVNILAVGGTTRLRKCFVHPIFGLSYYDPSRKVNVVCANKVLTDPEKFRVTVDSFGAFEVMALPRPDYEGALFRTQWRRGVLMFNHSEITPLSELPDDE